MGWSSFRDGRRRGSCNTLAGAEGTEDRMTYAWKQLEGQVINGEFHLRQHLCGSDDRAVFLSVHGEEQVERAAIKLILANPQNAEIQLSRWRLAANLAHP